MLSSEKLPASHLATASLSACLNKTFDLLNSSNPSDTVKVQQGLSLEEAAKLIPECVKEISSWKIIKTVEGCEVDGSGNI